MKPIKIAFTAVGLVALAAAPAAALADMTYFAFEYSGLQFQYTRNANDFTPGTVIGSITIDELVNSALVAEKISTGPDDSIDFGGDDDVVLGWTPFNQGDFTFALSADVLYLGPNSYHILASGTGGKRLSGTDSTGSGGGTSGNSYEASLSSNFVYFDGTLFRFDAGLGSAPGNDAILLDNDTPDGPAWTFIGSDGSSIGLSGSGAEDRTNYGTGDIFQFHVYFDLGVRDLDWFFSGDRDHEGAQTKVTVIPVPAAVVLGVVGLAAIVWAKRRML
jgi:hypothetical protein